jgi:M6 family metalloprotease-like protein
MKTSYLMPSLKSVQGKPRTSKMGVCVVGIGAIFMLAGCLDSVTDSRPKADPAQDHSTDETPTPHELTTYGPLREGLPAGNPMALRKLTSNGTGTPLVVMLVRKTSGTPLAQSKTWYENRFFGSTYPNVKDYFKSLSLSNYTYRKAYVIEVDDINTPEFETKAGVVLDGDDPDDTTIRKLKRARQLFIEKGYNLNAYDLNGNTSLGNSEMQFVVISDLFSTAATRNIGTRVDKNGMTLPGSIVAVGDKQGIQNIAHELMHVLGASDLYGPANKCFSEWITLMSCTITEADKPVLLDPFFRKKFEWFSIISENLQNVDLEFKLRAVSRDVSGPGGVADAYRISRLGTSREKLVFEYRKKDGAYDNSLAQEGVIAWYEKTNSSGDLTTVPYSDDASKNVRAHFTLKPVDCVGDPSIKASQGGKGALKPGNKYRFKWQDGTDSGWLIEAAQPATDGSVKVTAKRSSSAASCPNG